MTCGGNEALGKSKIRIIIRCAIGLWLERNQTDKEFISPRTKLIWELSSDIEAGRVKKAMECAFTISGLSSKERDVLIERYGLNEGRYQTLESLGVIFNVTRERIRQIQEHAFKKLNRPPDLREALAKGIRRLEPTLLRHLDTKQVGFVPLSSQHDIITSLGGWESLLVELEYDGIDNWLNQRAERTSAGWLCGRTTKLDLERAKSTLTEYLTKQVIPVPLTVASLDTSLGIEVIQIVGLHGYVRLTGDFLTVDWLGTRQQRVSERVYGTDL